MNLSPLRSRPLLWLLLSILSAASMAWYVIAIWSFNQPPQFSDLYARWWGAHELLLHGRNPYSPAVSHEIQRVIYGEQVISTPEDPSGIGGGFAYPLYTAFLLWPVVYFSFRVVRILSFCAFLPVSVFSLECWLRSLGFRPPLWLWFTIAIFTFGSFPSLQAAKLQNLSLVAAALIAFTVLLLSAGNYLLAGVVLALSTFKPQFTIVLIPWLALWTASDWRRRRFLAWGFLGTMFLLIVASEWLLPGWIGDFVGVARAYSHYTYGHSIFDVWFMPSFGPLASALLLAIVLGLCWAHRREPANSTRFLLDISLVLAATVVVIPTLAPHAQLLLLPGFLCLLHHQAFPQTSSSWIRIFRGAVWILFAWPWVSAFILLLAGLRYPTTALVCSWEVPLYSSAVLPVAVFLVLAILVRTVPETAEWKSHRPVLN
jgi:hypothetical protein